MKNIWILPTYKPSRLFIIDKSKMFLSEPPHLSFSTVGGKVHKIEGSDLYQPQHVYITSDEEIEEGDCVLINDEIVLTNIRVVEIEIYQDNSKKIILTTDQDLIKNGVQPIDDEFLQWFVKNPNCEKIEVEKILLGKVEGTTMLISKYKIIIPKEEPKQEMRKVCKCKRAYENPLSEICSLCWNELYPNEKDEIKNEDLLEPKQETLEEAAERITMIKDWDFESSEANGYYDYVEGFKEGAKWQQERMHSNEEVLQILFRFTNKFDLRKNIDISFQEQLKWFEQFKK